MTERKEPHHIEAEQSVLGAIFLSKEALQKACEALSEESFYLERHRLIFEAMKKLMEDGSAVDLTTVTAVLTKQKNLSKAGGVEYLSEIVSFVPSAANVDYYIGIVNEMAIRRKLISTATEISSLGYNDEGSVNEFLDEAERKIFNISKYRKVNEFKPIQEVLSKAQADLESLASHGNEITGIASGFYDLDKMTAGFHGREMIIIAARPGMGKTALAMNVASFVATNSDKSVAIFNLEMGAEQLATRMISSLGQVEGSKLSTGRLDNNDWKRVNEAISQLADSKIYIDDTSDLTIADIRAKCRRLASSDKNLGLIVIDYLQLISGGSKYGSNRQQEVSDISRGLKTMAMELDIPVIALAQLSRDVEKRENKRPILSDLRESGSIEQDADIVGFIHSEDSVEGDENTALTELIIRKHRNGPVGTVNLLFKKNVSTFLNFRNEM